MGVTDRFLAAAVTSHPASAIIADADQRDFDPACRFAYALEFPVFAPETRAKQGAI